MSFNDDAALYDIPQSPGLVPFKPKSKPDPEPLPIFQTRRLEPLNPTSQQMKDRNKAGRRRTRPAPHDYTLLREMGPNMPDAHRHGMEVPLNSASQSEVSDLEMGETSTEASSGSPRRVKRKSPPRSESQQSGKGRMTSDRYDVHASETKRRTTPRMEGDVSSLLEGHNGARSRRSQSKSSGPADAGPFSPSELDQASSDISIKATQGPMAASLTSPGIGTFNPMISDEANPLPGVSHVTLISDAQRPLLSHLSTPQMVDPGGAEARPPDPASEATEALTNGHSRRNVQSPATSPNLRIHTISESNGAPEQKLPALQTTVTPTIGGPSSPHQQRLPPFGEIRQIADDTLANGLVHHSRTSYPSAPVAGPTPPFSGHPNNARSPYNQVSPRDSSNEFSPSFPPTPGHFDYRRASVASETMSHNPNSMNNEPTPESIDSHVSAASYITNEATPRASIDLSSRVLPPPTITAGVHQIAITSIGGFECDFPGCKAAPFLTQYLLTSHANVHSQSRPYYCSVQGCKRAEGGCGFKRKNELKRHALVHDSPGYMCPFCSDRVHEYPRPDNLQRHVNKNHPERSPDDPLLRAELAKRIEGGTKGRRRRGVGSSV